MKALFIGGTGTISTAIGETFHITSDESLSWNQIYQTLANILQVEFNPYYVSLRFLADTT